MAKVPNERFEIVKKALEKNPKATYDEVKKAVERKGFDGLPPVVYGRAKSLLGLAKKSSGRKKTAKKTTARKGTARKIASRGIGRKRGPGRPRKESNPLDSLDSVIQSMKDTEAERNLYRDALDEIQGILDRLR